MKNNVPSRDAPEMMLIGCHRNGADPVEIINVFRSEGFAVQPVRADMVFGAEHLITAYMHAARAFERGTNSADDLMTEFLLYAACDTQITKAIERMKVTTQSSIAILIVPPPIDRLLENILKRLKLGRDDDLMAVTSAKLSNAAQLGVNGDESVADSVLEKIALLDIIKR
jgi:KEOPS complex subunit Cgi121